MGNANVDSSVGSNFDKSLSNSRRGAIRLARAKGFSAAYRSFDPQLSAEENERRYGRHSRGPGFGFNFTLEAHIEGEVDELTGMIVNLTDLDRWLGEVVGPLDHQMLHELGAFSGSALTLERLAAHCSTELKVRLAQAGAKARVSKVRIYEGQDLWVDCF